jgi:hypothetical protein
MKKLISFCLLCFVSAGVFAQANSDSIAYQRQRAKINAMLAVRGTKFGQYDQSLSQHTGIFGLQTKRDIRRSNDILMDIVKTDNDIFVQTKILLDYRTFQQNEAVSHSTQADSSSLGYMHTINTLRDQNDKLKSEITAMDTEHGKKSQTALAIIIGLIVIVLFLLRAKYVKKD